MAKRKAGVNDIIFELDDDTEISSEDEGKESKISRLQVNPTVDLTINNRLSEGSCVEVICSPNTNDRDREILSPPSNKNGGKTSPSVMLVENSPNVISVNSQETEDEVDNIEKVSTISLNNAEDLDVGYWDETPAGCENKTPLLTVRFKNKKLANDYKEKVKEFMIKLIKFHEEESLTESASDTDLDLDIWPEDLNDDLEEQTGDEMDNLFFVDAAPCNMEPVEVPRYSQTSTIISNSSDKEPMPPPTGRRKLTCFNCDGAHPLRDCPLPRNNARIVEKRKNMPAKLGRYHVEDEQKYGHLIPGRISGALRHALKLKRNDLPLHIYRMRLLGYPPGWLEEARISHSGIAMFDSRGNAILDPEEEEGELHQPGSRDKFDIKKILDFPGFNVPASSRYKEKAHTLGLPPMSEQDSKILMLQMLAPNAMKAYKRKKLTLFPSGLDCSSQEGHAEMELGSGDEETSFPSVPPLPDEAPPPVPPPPDVPPPDSPFQPPGTEDNEESTQDEGEKSADDMEIVGITEVKDIPVPQPTEMITIDDDDDEKEQENSRRNSLSLDDLEEKKRLLLSALESDDVIKISQDIFESQNSKTPVNDPEVSKEKDGGEIISDTVESNEVINDANGNTKDANDEKVSDPNEHVKETSVEVTNANETDEVTDNAEEKIETDPEIDQSKEHSASSDSPATNSIDSPSTAITKTGDVKTTKYGTPVMNIASPYVTLPSDVKFAKDICDVIYFENLPNSTGKYKKISSLLKKVKSEVDRIQES